MILILGSGPSGLIAANYVKNCTCEEFRVITIDELGGFQPYKFEDIEFTVGQRTMFYEQNLLSFLDTFLNTDGDYLHYRVSDMTKSVGVKFEDIIADYPLQNNLGAFNIWKRLAVYLSYINRDRRKAKNGNYADWVLGNYGSFLAYNIILPHTWKTLKEDLWAIDAEAYGKKVVPMRLVPFTGIGERVREITNSKQVLEALFERVRGSIIKGEVKRIDIESKVVKVHSEEGDFELDFDTILNTIALPKFVDLLDATKLSCKIQDTLFVAQNSLHYNNMFLGIFILPTSFINTDKSIVYFPERDYLFSKVNIERDNGVSLISCEVSFRKNDEGLFHYPAYRNKFMEKIEDDLKRGGVVKNEMFSCYSSDYKIITPAYIICDSNYQPSNSLLQNFLEHNGIFNVGRFSQWLPFMRIEHSIMRMEGLLGLCKWKEED